MNKPVVTRFAPSPTGMLHIGGVRTALFCWLYARKHGGRFILRIEDMDLYRARIQELLDRGLAYRCRCTKEQLEERRKAAEATGKPFQYNRGVDAGHGCRDEAYDASEPFSVRLKMPEGFEPWLEDGAIVLEDRVKGHIEFPADSLDDWIIARTGEAGQIGVPTYNFCVVIDDTSMEVTHVIRGDDHVSNTPKQIALYHALGFDPPEFAHVPMILGKDGAKLSKRHGATSITEYQALGLLPSAVRLALARLSWTPKIDGHAIESAEEELLTDEQMIQLFDLDQIQKSSARFDMDKLMWMNQKLIQRASWQELEPHLRPFLPDAWDGKSEEWKARAITCTQKGKSLVEMAEALRFCWERPAAFDEKGVAKFMTEAVKPALREVCALRDFAHDALERDFNAILEGHGLKLKDLAQALRVALCGKPVSPPIFDTLALLGPDEVVARLGRWL